MRAPGLQEIANPGQLAGAGLRPALQPAGEPREYAMTMWFTVSVSTLDQSEPSSIGAWSACSGLDVMLTPDGPFEDGGNYVVPRYQPGRITYNKVTLERVMTESGTKAVHDWLKELAGQWVSGKQSGSALYPTVTISLYSAPWVLVHEWVLKEAIPVSWTVPPLATSGGGFAVEKLVVQHGGFLEVPEQQQAKFELAGPDGRRLSFEYNPAKIQLSRSREAANGKKQLSGPGENVIDTNALSIDLSDLRLEGSDAVADASELLRDWLEFVPGSAVPAAAPPAPAAPEAKPTCANCSKTLTSNKNGSSPGKDKKLSVVWGQGRGGMPATVTLRKFDLNLSRFTPDGRPSRATVSLKLQECATSETGDQLSVGVNTAHPAEAPGTARRSQLPPRGTGGAP